MKMDVLKPPLIYIGNRIYRRNPIKRSEQEPYREQDDEFTLDMTYEDEVCDANLSNIEETDSGYRLAIPISSAYFKFIIGKKGETMRRIENETCTSIRIPRPGQGGDVLIQGRDKKGIVSARTRIDILVESGRQKIPFTHFLSIPALDPDIKQGFETFKEKVLASCSGDRGIDGTIFQKPAKLHLTIGIMTLVDQAEIDKANELLQQCQQTIVRSIVGSQPLMAHFIGLEYMNDDPAEVDVLYAKVRLDDYSSRLEDFVNALVSELASAGLMREEYDRVKLHVTVMNTLFRKDPSGLVAPPTGRQAPTRDRESFDATNVLRLFGEYDFGHMCIDTIHLSQRLGTGPNGYYGRHGNISLPTSSSN